MVWIHGFEIMCYVITAMLIFDVARKRDREEGGLFLSAALAGFALELLAVRLTDIYHYSCAFYIVIGPAPYQFPFFGGLMWGGVAVCARRIAKKFPFGPLMTALFAGWLVVSMDLLLDVAAIRLDGGFWIWDGRPINLAVTHHLLMSVVWVNFLGYMFETPALVYMSDLRRKRAPSSAIKDIFISLLIGAAAVAVVGILSAVALFLDGLTDEWFSCVAFLILWCGVFFKLIMTLAAARKNLSFRGKKDWVLFVFWAAMYAYCLAGLWSLGVIRAAAAYGAFGLFLGLMTLALCLLHIENTAANKESRSRGGFRFFFPLFGIYYVGKQIARIDYKGVDYGKRRHRRLGFSLGQCGTGIFGPLRRRSQEAFRESGHGTVLRRRTGFRAGAEE